MAEKILNGYTAMQPQGRTFYREQKNHCCPKQTPQVNLTHSISRNTRGVWGMRRGRKVAEWGQERIPRMPLLVCFLTQAIASRAHSLLDNWSGYSHCTNTQISVWHYITRNSIQKFKTKQPEEVTTSCLIGQLLSLIFVLSNSAKSLYSCLYYNKSIV